jgi:type IV pilus assembly protein PilP
MIVWAGCEEEIPTSSGRGMGGGAPPPAAAAAPASSSPLDQKLILRDEDFVDSERNRDPFRRYDLTPGPPGGAPAAFVDPQRPVVMPDTNVEEMKLIAVVLGLARPKAMLTAPDGVGYVVQRGDYLGKAKVLQATGSVPMTLNWRVDRIREHEVVLTRQDPTDASHTPMSRIITMID